MDLNKAAAPLRDTANWRLHIADKSAHRIAEMIIGDLVGYRSTSRFRAEDTALLANAIRAIMELAVANGVERTMMADLRENHDG